MNRESEELDRVFCRNGIQIFGRTQDFSIEEIRQNRKFSLVKAQEIKAWLAQHPECVSCVENEKFLVPPSGLKPA